MFPIAALLAVSAVVLIAVKWANRTNIPKIKGFLNFMGCLCLAVYTLGTSPWDDSVKKTRKAAATAVKRRAVQMYRPFIDLKSTTKHQRTDI
jgi:hypothetical protein